MLILEGGAAGHMMHPYENPDLEFSKMMDIIRAAAGGFQGINVTGKNRWSERIHWLRR